jgi:hypothetical protein
LASVSAHGDAAGLESLLLHRWLIAGKTPRGGLAMSSGTTPGEERPEEKQRTADLVCWRFPANLDAPSARATLEKVLIGCTR